MNKNWQLVIDKLANMVNEENGKISEAAFDGVLRGIRCLGKEGNTIYLGTYNEFNKKRINDKYYGILLEMIREIPEWSNIERIIFKVDEKYDLIDDQDENKFDDILDIKNIKANESSTLSPKYKFETYIVGKSNEFAYSASLAVAKNPGKEYNPLFIYGGVGLGKTHLMQAAGHYIKENNPKFNIVYITAETFLNEFLTRMQENKTEEFRMKYRNIDVLLVDDIQFIAGKESTQEEFFHTFVDLFEKQKQIILSSDRTPSQIEKLPDRLVSRFESGMIADIQAPDLELREAILRREASIKGVNINNESINYLARKIVSNIRTLEGAFIRVCAYSHFKNLEITPDLIDMVLRDVLTTSQKKITIEIIQRAVCDYFNIKLSEISDKKRTQSIAYPRQIAMYLSRELTNESLPQIGKSFGGRDHTTVMHAIKKITSALEKDQNVKEELDKIIRIITSK